MLSSVMQTSLLVTKAFSACTLCARVSPPDTHIMVFMLHVCNWCREWAGPTRQAVEKPQHMLQPALSSSGLLQQTCPKVEGSSPDENPGTRATIRRAE